MVSCGTYKERLVETELWMSSGGTSSSLHSHSDHNIHCVIDGRKDFILIEGKHKDAFLYEETVKKSCVFLDILAIATALVYCVSMPFCRCFKFSHREYVVPRALI